MRRRRAARAVGGGSEQLRDGALLTDPLKEGGEAVELADAARAQRGVRGSELGRVGAPIAHRTLGAAAVRHRRAVGGERLGGVLAQEGEQAIGRVLLDAENFEGARAECGDGAHATKGCRRAEAEALRAWQRPLPTVATLPFVQKKSGATVLRVWSSLVGAPG